MLPSLQINFSSVLRLLQAARLCCKLHYFSLGRRVKYAKKRTNTHREEGEDKCRKGERKGARRDVEKKTDVACDSLWFRRVDDAEKNSHTACREGNAARKFCEQEAAEKERDREREK